MHYKGRYNISISLYLSFNCGHSHSFGYECTKRENLHILDTNTVVFSAGNLVQILNLKTMEQTYIGGTNDGGIGAITVSSSTTSP
jgi:hypothetical protein